MVRLLSQGSSQLYVNLYVKWVGSQLEIKDEWTPGFVA